ncbi:unnamed protein product [Caenorhabditis nigoni]
MKKRLDIFASCRFASLICNTDTLCDSDTPTLARQSPTTVTKCTTSRSTQTPEATRKPRIHRMAPNRWI